MGYIRVLEIMHYPLGGVREGGRLRSWSNAINKREPTWSDIEEAIRRLDRDTYPYIWLHMNEPIEAEEPVGMNVIGGRGEYALSFSLPDANLYYHDDSRSRRLVRIWESDQGSIFAETSLCSDLERVLSITHHFFETGEPDTSVDWQE